MLTFSACPPTERYGTSDAGATELGVAYDTVTAGGGSLLHPVHLAQVMTSTSAGRTLSKFAKNLYERCRYYKCHEIAGSVLLRHVCMCVRP